MKHNHHKDQSHKMYVCDVIRRAYSIKHAARVGAMAVNMVKIKVGRLSEFNSSPCFFIIIIDKAPSDIAKRCLNSHNLCTHAQVLPTLPVVTVRSRHA